MSYDYTYADAMLNSAAIADRALPLGPQTIGTFMNHCDETGASSLNEVRVLTAAEMQRLSAPAAAVTVAEPIAPERPSNPKGHAIKWGERYQRDPAPRPAALAA